MPPAAVLAVAYLAGAVPVSWLVARLVAGTDLREVGTGTVSGTLLYEVAGFGPLVVGGVLDVGKGAVGPLLAADRPVVAGLAAGLAVAGHNWSPFLRGGGGRGISPALGALAVVAWPGSVLLLAGLVGGRAAHHTALGSFVAQALLVPLLWLVGGGMGTLAGGCVLAALWGKRLAGNRPPDGGARTLANRLLFDRDDARGGHPAPTGDGQSDEGSR